MTSLIAEDLLQRAVAEDPAFDPTDMIDSCIRSAVLEATSALAWLDSNPDRKEYIRALAELHPDKAGAARARRDAPHRRRLA